MPTSARSSRCSARLRLLVLKTARYVDPTEVIELGEILVFVGDDFIITVRHGEGSELHGIRERLEQNPELLSAGPGAVVHAIVDKVVDDYQPAIDGLGQDIEEVEAEVFSPARPDRTERIYRLKREVLEFHHASAPLVEPVDRLARGRYGVIPTEVQHLLPRRQRPPAARRTSSSRASATCSPRAPGEPRPRSPCARTRTCARSRRAWRSSPCPR